MKLLIPLSYLNEACFLSTNIDEKKFKMVLKIAQEELRIILGIEFFDQVSTQYNPQGDTLSADNSTLYEDYIKDYLAWRTYFEYLRFAQADSTPTGIREHKDENSDILADFKLHSYEKNVLSQSNRYRDNMINFLKTAQANDSTKYPLFVNTCKPVFSFAVSAINKTKTDLVSVNKSVTFNE